MNRNTLGMKYSMWSPGVEMVQTITLICTSLSTRIYEKESSKEHLNVIFFLINYIK